MNSSILLSIAMTGFAVGFMHAAIPTHWLPFVLAGRAQGWTHSKTLIVTALASLGHIVFTTLLGVLVVFLGIKVESWLGNTFPLIVSLILILFGCYYLFKQVKGSGGGHHHWKLPWMKHSHADHHAHDEVRRIDTGHGVVVLSIFEEGMPPCFRIAAGAGDHKPPAQSVTVRTTRPDGTTQLFRFADKGEYLQSVDEIPEPHEFSAELQIGHGSHTHDCTVEFAEHAHGHAETTHAGCDRAQPSSGRSDKAVIIGLLLLLTLSPCEGFLPVYLSGIQYGWGGFAFLSLTLVVATMSGMIFFTWLTLAGLKHFRLEVLEKYETGILGSLLILLGLIVLIFERTVI